MATLFESCTSRPAKRTTRLSVYCTCIDSEDEEEEDSEEEEEDDILCRCSTSSKKQQDATTTGEVKDNKRKTQSKCLQVGKPGFVFQAVDPIHPGYVDHFYRDTVRGYRQVDCYPYQSHSFDAATGEFRAGQDMSMEFYGTYTLTTDYFSTPNEKLDVGARTPVHLVTALVVNGRPVRESVSQLLPTMRLFPVCTISDRLSLCVGDTVSLAVSADDFLEITEHGSISCTFGGHQLIVV